jgi:DNA-directed RNA polymerase alpha subunit
MRGISQEMLAWYKFQHRDLSKKTIQALMDCSIDFPERLLFMTEKQISSIPGVGKVSLSEIKAYRHRFIGVARKKPEGKGELEQMGLL